MVDVRVRIRGVNQYVRDLANTNKDTLEAAHKGCLSAAEYLKDKIIAKFGVYQNTGGDPNGRGSWKKLKIDTRIKKSKKGQSNKPLIATGAASRSWYVVEGGIGRISASVYSNSKYLIHHIFGAPKGHVPMRDPARVTAVEEADECSDIIIKAIEKALDRSM